MLEPLYVVFSDHFRHPLDKLRLFHGRRVEPASNGPFGKLVDAAAGVLLGDGDAVFPCLRVCGRGGGVEVAGDELA